MLHLVAEHCYKSIACRQYAAGSVGTLYRIERCGSVGNGNRLTFCLPECRAVQIGVSILLGQQDHCSVR